MTNLLLSRKSFIGFDTLLNAIEDFTSSATDSYPPYNVVKDSDNSYTIELATAGFSTDDIEIEELNKVLTISGSRAKKREQTAYIHKGISAKKFSRVFKLADNAKVTNARMENGILEITITIEQPKSKKANKISIKGN